MVFFGEHGAVMRREFQLTSLVYFGLRFLDVPDDMLYLSNFRGFHFFRILQDAPHLSVSKNPGSASNLPQISRDDP